MDGPPHDLLPASLKQIYVVVEDLEEWLCGRTVSRGGLVDL